MCKMERNGWLLLGSTVLHDSKYLHTFQYKRSQSIVSTGSTLWLIQRMLRPDGVGPKSLRKPIALAVNPDNTAAPSPSPAAEAPRNVPVNKLVVAPSPALVGVKSDAIPTKAALEVKKKSLAELLAARDSPTPPSSSPPIPPAVAPSSVESAPVTAATTTVLPPLSSSKTKSILKPVPSSPAEIPSTLAADTPKPPPPSIPQPSAPTVATVHVDPVTPVISQPPSASNKRTLSFQSPQQLSGASSFGVASPVLQDSASDTPAATPDPPTSQNVKVPVDPKDLHAHHTATGPLSFAPRNVSQLANAAVHQHLVQGVRGAVRQRLLKDMLDDVEDCYKIIICDQIGAETLNACFRMHELMEHDIILVEDISMPRQPVITSPALYLLSPDNEEGVSNMLADWDSRPKYKSPHVFWTSRVSRSVLQRIAADRFFTRTVVTMKDMMLDFVAGESLLFHFNQKLGAEHYIPVEGRPAPPSALQEIATKLVGVFHTFASGAPIIRYQAQSSAAKVFSGYLTELVTLLDSPPLSKRALDRPVLIVVDRCYDLLEALVHHRTYQCLCDELCPLDNGIYEQTYQGRKGEELKRVMAIDERDEYWCRFRHESFDKCLRVFQTELKQLLAANPSLAHGVQRGAGVAMAGSAMRALPEFLEQQSKLSTHVDICTKITQQYTKLQLARVIELELDMLLHRAPMKDMLKRLKAIGGDLSIPAEVRVRLMALCAAFATEKDFPHDSRLQMISACGLGDELLPILHTIDLALPQISTQHLERLRKRRQAETPAPSKLPPSSAPQGAETEGTGLATYPNGARHILEGVINDNLSKVEFPFVPGELNESGQPKGRKDGKRSLRSGARRDTGEEQEEILDLGYEGQYVLRSPQKVVLFVLGGVTYGEARSAYELAKEYGREVIIGGCHILQSKEFIQDLKLCGRAPSMILLHLLPRSARMPNGDVGNSNWRRGICIRAFRGRAGIALTVLHMNISGAPSTSVLVFWYLHVEDKVCRLMSVITFPFSFSVGIVVVVAGLFVQSWFMCWSRHPYSYNLTFRNPRFFFNRKRITVGFFKVLGGPACVLSPSHCGAMSSDHRVRTGEKNRRPDPTPELSSPFDETGQIREDSKSPSRQAEEYYRLLHSIFHHKPVTRHSRVPVARTIGNADEDILAASLRTFKELLEQEEELEAYHKRRENVFEAHSSFTLTDFTAPIPPSFMEAAAALLCECINEHGVFLRRRRFPKPTFIVSSGLRGCGSLTQAVAHRMGLAYSLSNWYPDGTKGDVMVTRCEGIGGMGNVYLNSIPANGAIIVLVDVIHTSKSTRDLIEAIRQVDGTIILGVYGVAQMVQGKADPLQDILGVPLWTLMNVHLGGEITRITQSTPDSSIAFPSGCSPLRLMPRSTISVLKRMSPAEVQKKLCRVASTFSGVPVLINEKLQYPYCDFSLTDFKPALDPSIVEDIADLAIHFGDFTRSDILVSEGDRGGAPMLQAISVRTQLPYVIASWTLNLDTGGVCSNVTNVGFSGSNSQLSVSGIQAGMRCTLVDDMLSSGGTADAILSCIRAVGAFTVEGVFASEKLYPEEGRYLPVRKGKNRLNALFPETAITCLVQFVIRGDKTEEPPSRGEKIAKREAFRADWREEVVYGASSPNPSLFAVGEIYLSPLSSVCLFFFPRNFLILLIFFFCHMYHAVSLL
eukprot:gene3976-2835_t